MASLDSFRAAWAERLALKSPASLSPDEVWGLNMLAAGSDGPLSTAAARATLAAARERA